MISHGIDLAEVTPPAKRFAAMRGIIPNDLFDATLEEASRLRGLEITYINSNQNRGGVFEHLLSLVPLMNDLGIHARWYAASEVPQRFYEATRLIYNGLQGEAVALDDSDWEVYEECNAKVADQVTRLGGDVVLVQDHQFAGSRLAADSSRLWIWQSHSETSSPADHLVPRFAKYLAAYDGLLFYCPEYIFGTSDRSVVHCSTIALDPTSEKNLPMSVQEAHARVAEYGFDAARPLIVQVSRIDIWKDFPGVARAWSKARRDIPELQLALIGSTTPNNVRAAEIVAEVQQLIGGATGAQFMVDVIKGRDVKAFQVAATVAVQNSHREGFGLAVSEALWSGTPVVGRDSGGIRIQVIDGECGYLVSSDDECADRLSELVNAPEKCRGFGDAGRVRVRNNFLMPRLIRDELRLLHEVGA